MLLVFFAKVYLLYSYVENGRNPELFTQSFVERTATENQFTNGKIKAVDVGYFVVYLSLFFSFFNLYVLGIQAIVN